MAANYLHGVETTEVKSGSVPIQVIKSAVVSLVGIAPTGTANTPVLVQNVRDAAQFGKGLTGFTIPQSISAILTQGTTTIIVVNVFDPVKHTTQVTQESKTVTDSRLKLDYAPIGEVTVLDQNNAPTTYVIDVDYALDEFGNFIVLSGEITEGEQLKFSYKRFYASKISDSDVIGSTDTDGVRKGFHCLDLVSSRFGFTPKIIIAPGFCTRSAVAAEMIARAPKYRAIAGIDAPEGATPSEVIAARGPAGTMAGFKTSSDRVRLLYPMVKAYDEATDDNINAPLSPYWAGLIGKVDAEEGYWTSVSNHEILGIEGLERDITAAISDPESEANLLNEKGITTVFNSFGSGFRLWGNRTAAWPTNASPENFECVRRTADVVNESIEYNMLPYIDKPLNRGNIDSIRESVNNFLRTLQGRGALIDGICKYDKSKNPPDQIALGRVTFDTDMMPPTPAEWITMNSKIDKNLLKNII